LAYKILHSRWWTTKDGCIGIVAVDTGKDIHPGEWKACIGIGYGFSIKGDEQYVAAWGSGLQPEEAQVFFSWLDIEKYKKA